MRHVTYFDPSSAHLPEAMSGRPYHVTRVPPTANRLLSVLIAVLGAILLLSPVRGFAQDAVRVLDKRAPSTEVIEFLVTPSGLFPKTIEAPPGDYVLVLRRADFEAPLRLDFAESTGRKVTITAMSEKARMRREVIRLGQGIYVASISGSTEKEWTATIRIDPQVKERTSSN